MRSPTHPGPASSSHVPPLDGIRGLSAVIIVLTHAPKLGLTPLLPDDLGNYAVMVFFALSGFLMGHLYLHKPFDGPSAAHYVAARIARIVPLYYVIVLWAWVMFNFVDPSFFYAMTTSALPRHLAFFGSVSYFWTIGPEVQFYAIFVTLWWAVAKARAGAMLPVTLVLGAAALLFVLQPLFPGITIFSKLHIFLGGVAIAGLRRPLAGTLQHSWPAFAMQAGLVGLCFVMWLDPPALRVLFYTSPRDHLLNVYYGDLRRIMVAFMLIFAFSFETRFANGLLANRFARSLGTYSYSIYLLHGPVLWGLERAGLFAATGPAPGFAIGLAAVYAVGWLSFTVIEMPAQRLLRKPLTRVLAGRAALPA